MLTCIFIVCIEVNLYTLFWKMFMSWSYDIELGSDNVKFHCLYSTHAFSCCITRVIMTIPLMRNQWSVKLLASNFTATVYLRIIIQRINGISHASLNHPLKNLSIMRSNIVVKLLMWFAYWVSFVWPARAKPIWSQKPGLNEISNAVCEAGIPHSIPEYLERYIKNLPMTPPKNWHI